MTVQFKVTTKGWICEVDGKLRWFIREELKQYMVFEQVFNGFILRPANSNPFGVIYGHKSLEDAKRWIYEQELMPTN